MADSSVNSRKKFNFLKPFKSIGRTSKGRPSTAESFGPSSPLDPWDPDTSSDTLSSSDFHPAFSSPRPSPSASSWSRSPSSPRTVFTPQPNSFSSAPFCPPSPTPSQLAFIPPSPPRPLKVLPPRSASLRPGEGAVNGGLKKKQRAASPRLKSPRTGGPLRPFGRKPSMSMLDSVLGVYDDLSDQPLTPPATPYPMYGNRPHPAVSPLYPHYSPRPASPLSTPKTPVVHLRQPKGRRKLSSPTLADRRRTKTFGATTNSVNEPPASSHSRALSSTSSDPSSARSRSISLSDSRSDVSTRRVDSTVSAATTVPSRFSHSSKPSRDGPIILSIADEEFKKVMAEGKIRSRTFSNDSSADGSQSSRTTSRSVATHRSNNTFGPLTESARDPNDPSSPQSATSSLSFASKMPRQPAQSTRAVAYAASQSSPVSQSKITPFISMASLRSLRRAQEMDAIAARHSYESGRRPSLPTILSTISLVTPSPSPEDKAPSASTFSSRLPESELKRIKSERRKGSVTRLDIAAEPVARMTAGFREALVESEADEDKEMDKLMIQVTNDEGTAREVEVWTNGVAVEQMSPAMSVKSDGSRKSTDSDLALLIPLFRSPPMSPPFTPLTSHAPSPRHSFSLPPPSSASTSFFPHSPITTTTPIPSQVEQGAPAPLSLSTPIAIAPSASYAIFGDYALPPRSPDTPSYDPDRLRSPGPWGSPSETKAMRRISGTGSVRNNKGKRASWRYSRDLPLTPPPTGPLPPPPLTSIAGQMAEPVSPVKELPDLPVEPSSRMEESLPPIPTTSAPTSPILPAITLPRPSDTPSTSSLRPLALVLKHHPSPVLAPAATPAPPLLPPPSTPTRQTSPPPPLPITSSLATSPPTSPSHLSQPISPTSPTTSFAPPTSPMSPSYSETDTLERGFWDRRGSTGGDSLLDLYSTAASFYSPPVASGNEGGMYFSRGEQEVHVRREGEDEREELDEVEEESEGEELDERNGPVIRRTDVVPRFVGLGQGEREESTPSPAFPFDL